MLNKLKQKVSFAKRLLNIFSSPVLFDIQMTNKATCHDH
ncbi:hypothetical protein VRK_41740 [Vibrio sp. MEBiC08052]|nr:hypothetical protein VRK_41740 [Vibrio sp. MEBiC08052]